MRYNLESSIEELIEEYKKQTKICSEIDYSNKSSISKNNKAVKRMYEIIQIISQNSNEQEIDTFSQLLKDKENKTHLWSAVQILEKLKVKKEIEKEALEIIEDASKGEDANALGFKYWLKHYKSNK